MASKKDPDAKKDAAEKKAGKPDVDSPRVKAQEKKLGVGGAGKVGKGAGPVGLTPANTFGANRRFVAPPAGPPVRTKKPPVGFGGDVNYGKTVDKGGGTVGYPAKNTSGSVTGYAGPKGKGYPDKNKTGGARD